MGERGAGPVVREHAAEHRGPPPPAPSRARPRGKASAPDGEQEQRLPQELDSGRRHRSGRYEGWTKERLPCQRCLQLHGRTSGDNFLSLFSSLADEVELSALSHANTLQPYRALPWLASLPTAQCRKRAPGLEHRPSSLVASL